jgi:hypothetical protein
MFPGLSKLTLDNMKSLSTPQAIQSITSEVQEWLQRLQRMSGLTEQFEVPDIQEDMGEWGENAMGMGDIGVEAWKHKSKAWLRQSLGTPPCSYLFQP